jgi:hypothetical protein
MRKIRSQGDRGVAEAGGCLIGSADRGHARTVLW